MSRSLVRRVVTVVAAAGVVVAPLATAFAPSAAAAGPELCAYTGTTTSLTAIPATGSSSGSFTISGPGECAGIGTGAVMVTLQGTYDDVACGTGTAAGTATLSGAVNATLRISITLVAGQGALTIDSGGTGGGSVHLVPNAGGCVTGPVTDFTVAGNLAGSF
jgi:hypothetical protein